MTTPITEAPAPTVFVPTVVVPRQAGPVDAPVPTVVDHVRTHGVRCYWDLRACRWECRPD